MNSQVSRSPPNTLQRMEPGERRWGISVNIAYTLHAMSKTRIIEAVRNLDLESTKELLSAKPSLLKVTDRQGQNLLHLACSASCTNLKVPEAVRSGGDVPVGAFFISARHLSANFSERRCDLLETPTTPVILETDRSSIEKVIQVTAGFFLNAPSCANFSLSPRDLTQPKRTIIGRLS